MKQWISPEPEKYLALGLQLAGSVLLGFFAGFFLDKKLGSLPWGTLVGCALGLIAGFTIFVFQMRGLQSDDKQ